jgi:hypothetical protein
MLLVLILAVLLGWRVNKARQQRRVVAAVEQYGGWVHYDYEFVSGKLTPGQEPWAPHWLRADSVVRAFVAKALGKSPHTRRQKMRCYKFTAFIARS